MSQTSERPGGFFSGLRGIISPKAKPQPVEKERLLPSETFDEYLTKERARADRGGNSFVLLTVDVCAARDSEAYEAAVGVVSTLLEERTRVIDIKGWFSQRIGLILPLTTAEQAQIVWTHLEEAYKRKMTQSGYKDTVPLKSEIYTYPSDGKHHALSEVTNLGSRDAEKR